MSVVTSRLSVVERVHGILANNGQSAHISEQIAAVLTDCNCVLPVENFTLSGFRNLDLSGSTSNEDFGWGPGIGPDGNLYAWGEVRLFFIRNRTPVNPAAPTSATITLGNASSNPWAPMFGTSSNTLPLGGGDELSFGALAAGYPVTSSSKVLQIAIGIYFTGDPLSIVLPSMDLLIAGVRP